MDWKHLTYKLQITYNIKRYNILFIILIIATSRKKYFTRIYF